MAEYLDIITLKGYCRKFVDVVYVSLLMLEYVGFFNILVIDARMWYVMHITKIAERNKNV